MLLLHWTNAYIELKGRLVKKEGGSAYADGSLITLTLNWIPELVRGCEKFLVQNSGSEMGYGVRKYCWGKLRGIKIFGVKLRGVKISKEKIRGAKVSGEKIRGMKKGVRGAKIF